MGFMPDIDMYYAMVANEVDMVTVEAVGMAGSMVTGDGMHALMVGENTIEVMVTAEDETTMMTYTVMVTREDAEPTGNELLNRYDEDESGHIDLMEVSAAIDDYFRDEGDPLKLTLEEVSAVIDLYFL